MPYFKINARILPPFEAIDLPEDSFLDACYSTIGCRSIEVVQTIVPGLVLIVDEEAKCFDGWEKRINLYASFLYCASAYDVISGHAILARRKGPDLFPLEKCDVDCLVRLFSSFTKCSPATVLALFSF